MAASRRQSGRTNASGRRGPSWRPHARGLAGWPGVRAGRRRLVGAAASVEHGCRGTGADWSQEPAAFVGAAACPACHEAQISRWRASMHPRHGNAIAIHRRRAARRRARQTRRRNHDAHRARWARRRADRQPRRCRRRVRGLRFDAGTRSFRIITSASLNEERIALRLLEWRPGASPVLRELAWVRSGLEPEGIATANPHGRTRTILVYDSGRSALGLIRARRAGVPSRGCRCPAAERSRRPEASRTNVRGIRPAVIGVRLQGNTPWDGRHRSTVLAACALHRQDGGRLALPSRPGTGAPIESASRSRYSP